MDDRCKNLLRKGAFDSSEKEKYVFLPISHENRDSPTALSTTFSSLILKNLDSI